MPDVALKPMRTERAINDLAEIGLTADIIDLRSFFAKPDLLEQALASYRVIFVTGGNVFVLRRAMRQSGLDVLLRQRAACVAQEGDYVYAGFSAGCSVLGPTLRGIELVDDPNVVPSGYDSDIIWSGLSLIDFCFVPHYQSDHPESKLVDLSIAQYIKEKILFKALRDGEVLVV
jgi:dipeptidase E